MALTSRVLAGTTPSTATRRWPVRGWAGPTPTRSSTCLCTGEKQRVCVVVAVAAAHVDVSRTETATVTGHYQSPDDRPGDVDAFAREPFVVRFRAPHTGELPHSAMNLPTHVTNVVVAPPPSNQPSRSLSSSLNTPLQPTPPRSWKLSMMSCKT